MNILITGAKGFVGRNLVENLKTIQDGRNKTRPSIHIQNIYEYDLGNTQSELEEYCQKADFVFHLAGVNRPKTQEEFMLGNFGFSDILLSNLKKCKNTCPIMLASSLQATLLGRYADGEYGKSKKAGEDLFFNYEKDGNGTVHVYRFPNLFGKWCKPNYNSAVATFCHNIANDLPITVNDASIELELLYIDDLINEMLDLLEGKGHRCNYDGLTPVPCENGSFYYVPITHKVTLGKIVEFLEEFHSQPNSIIIPEIPQGSFKKKLYSTYLSYIPKEKIIFSLQMNEDARGSFTELLKTENCGQFSVNISKPGIAKGEHWHNTKWEFFIVVSGHALIQQRKIGTDEILSFEVSGEKIQAVHMLPGYAHNITNLSKTENLITVMWANERFDKDRPDTFFEKVEI